MKWSAQATAPIWVGLKAILVYVWGSSMLQVYC